MSPHTNPHMSPNEPTASELLAADDQSDLREVDVPRPARAPRTLNLSVADVGFLLVRLGEDCAPLQFLRELTQNALEAAVHGQATQISWDVDEVYKTPAGKVIRKLAITDNGHGMTGPEMVSYINRLASTGKRLGHEANFGVGAKIAAATRNHLGLVYLSWKDGHGAMVHLWRDPKTKQYGLKQLERPDGSTDVWAPISDELKPEGIDQHGTRVILLGNTPVEDTVVAPKDAPSPSAWVAKYLNTRYYQLPPRVHLRARQGWDAPKDSSTNVLRTITGQKPYLDKHAHASGAVELEHGAIARWWILNDSPALGSNSGFIESSGHVAALYRDELYEVASGRQGLAKLQQFGILFGARQVVIYIEPSEDPIHGQLSSNTARTDLLINRAPLPWAAWASEFRDKMPEQIRVFQDDIASRGDDKDRGEGIRERLKHLLELFDVRRYRPQSGGDLRIAAPEAGGGGSWPTEDEISVPSVPTGDEAAETEAGDEGGQIGGVFSTAIQNEGRKGDKVTSDPFPRVEWISVEDRTRGAGDLEDKAARYLDDQNTLLVNGDFRTFTDMEALWIRLYEKEHGKVPGLRSIVRDLVRQWYEQSLVETIIGLQGLRGSREWSLPDLQQAWSEAALTAVVMQRYHPYNAVKRDLAIRISSLKVAPGKKGK